MLSYELTDNDFTVDGGINDLTSVGGDLTLDGTLNVSVLGNSQLTAAGSYRLFDYAGSLTDNGLSLGTIALATGLAASIDTSTAGQVNLDVVEVPEPLAIALAAIGLAGVGCTPRRRRSNSFYRRQ